MTEFNIAQIVTAVAEAVPDRECFVHGDIRVSYREFLDRVNRFANLLHTAGIGAHTEREHLERHQSGQDHLALYLHNGREFLEANVGSFAARAAPFNVNYRYVDDELRYLLADQQATAVVYHSSFAPTLARVRDDLAHLRLLLQVEDDSGEELLPGASWYHEAVAAAPATPPPVEPSPDDLYVLCTGGTTGMPKGVLWRQADIWVSALGGISVRTKREFTSLAEIAEEAAVKGGFRNMPTAPFMHGAAQWTALIALTHGHTCVVPGSVRRLDPADVWATAEREKVTMLQLVGDAFARPLLEELGRHQYDLSSLRAVINGGAMLSSDAKRRFVEHLPGIAIDDGLGSSEAGPVASAVTRDEGARGAVFELGSDGLVLSADLTRVLAPGDEELGWLAKAGRIPLGYLGDADKTERTFPVLFGRRHVIVGDRARMLADGHAELHGRDSVTINSGGEKIFAEEVEQAVLRHPAVADVVVCGRPSQRWGSEVVAIVALVPDDSATAEDLLARAGESIARYKLPKEIIFTDQVQRSPAGKADYRWAAQQAVERSGRAGGSSEHRQA